MTSRDPQIAIGNRPDDRMLLIAVAGLFLSAHGRGAPTSKPPYGQWLDSKSDLERHFLEIRSDQPALAKWQHYFDVYEHHLARFRGTDVVICEVGINNGGSLALWRSYFGPRARIIGIDLFNASFMQANPLYGSPDRVVYGDQGSAKFWAEFARPSRASTCSSTTAAICRGCRWRRSKRCSLTSAQAACTPPRTS